MTAQKHYRVHTGYVRFFLGNDGAMFPYGWVTIYDAGEPIYGCMTYEL